MCIIMTPRFEPKETLLVVAPLRTDPEQEQMWQLTYINSIDTPPGVPQGAAPLMVVPVPLPAAKGWRRLDSRAAHEEFAHGAVAAYEAERSAWDAQRQTSEARTSATSAHPDAAARMPPNASWPGVSSSASDRKNSTRSASAGVRAMM